MWIFFFVKVFKYIGNVDVNVLFLFVFILEIFFLCKVILFINCMLYGCILRIWVVVLWIIVKVLGSKLFIVLFFVRCFLNLSVFFFNCLLVSGLIDDFNVLICLIVFCICLIWCWFILNIFFKILIIGNMFFFLLK